MLDASYSGHNMPASFQDSTNPPRPDGPPFGDTAITQPVFTARNQQVLPEISASIQKGFFQVDHKWTCYRRNYFAVSCSFAFKNHLGDGPYYLSRNGQDEPIHQFAVSISAKTAIGSNGESESRGLVQHTPKRDKATETVPGRQLISPTPNHALGASGMFPNATPLYEASQPISPAMMGSFGGHDNHGANSIPTTYTFERIQFQKATANNGKRRAQQQYFLVVVELSVNVARSPGDERWVVIATKESDQMVVRGRSPGHYKDNGRRDSQASMDPDRGTGAGGDAHHGSLPSCGYGHSSIDWMGSRQQGGHFGGSTYRQTAKAGFSPASLASSSTLTGTPTEVDLSEQSVLTPLSEGGEEALLYVDRHNTNRKRSYEDDEDEQLRVHHPAPFTDSMTSLSAFSAMRYSKLLCAS
ncbi:uncharacterized protein Z518_08311 [Rhinocladiella mackenziei CBS 650.93]|uniref:NDT80 domain-containing protein n=1 Tax=Rhinocladiella mackenziei CBS 650.93 TaxID=1442369 RepID=A0A0D2J0F6_9EURO|nr:uncharacterized protein Z518_08311 [Rhinocladiella mackenziei CBS 650.93]KIX02370.1 hypothetical protein Z518_08311 [Rhinocladiella mackenziei CBS 650.93]